MQSVALTNCFPQQARSQDIGITVGALISLELPDLSIEGQVRVIGFEQDKFLMVSFEHTPALQNAEGHVAALRTKNHLGDVEFESPITCVRTTPVAHAFIAWPQTIAVQKTHLSSRINTCIKANFDSRLSTNAAWPKHGVIEDLSRIDAKVRTPDRLGEFGQEILMDLALSSEETIEIAAIIRNAHVETEVVGEPHFVFGLQFLEMDEAVRTKLNHFIGERA